jgi:hypothetical protein
LIAIRTDLSAREIRNFGFVTLGGFIFIGFMLWYLSVRPAGGWIPQAWGYQGHARQVIALAMGCTGLVFALVCMSSHPAGLRLYVAWMTMGGAIGAVMSVVLLTLLFIVFLPVFSLIRLKDPLRMKRGAAGSYWEPHRPHEATLERMARPF